jgi:heme-degrading monooxygenase HmoA
VVRVSVSTRQVANTLARTASNWSVVSGVQNASSTRLNSPFVTLNVWSTSYDLNAWNRQQLYYRPFVTLNVWSTSYDLNAWNRQQQYYRPFVTLNVWSTSNYLRAWNRQQQYYRSFVTLNVWSTSYDLNAWNRQQQYYHYNGLCYNIIRFECLK